MKDERRAARALTILRIGVSALMVTHGVARIALGIVDDFGGFLTGVGFPVGLQLAWAATLFEVVGGSVLAAGRFVRLLALGFCAELAVGIWLVHWPEGWFVVGAGRNGMEYSVLLILSFLVVAYGGGPIRADEPVEAE